MDSAVASAVSGAAWAEDSHFRVSPSPSSHGGPLPRGPPRLMSGALAGALLITVPQGPPGNLRPRPLDKKKLPRPR